MGMEMRVSVVVDTDWEGLVEDKAEDARWHLARLEIAHSVPCRPQRSRCHWGHLPDRMMRGPAGSCERRWHWGGMKSQKGFWEGL